MKTFKSTREISAPKSQAPNSIVAIDLIGHSVNIIGLVGKEADMHLVGWLLEHVPRPISFNIVVG